MFHTCTSTCTLDMKLLGRMVCTLVILILSKLLHIELVPVYTPVKSVKLPVSPQHHGHCFELRIYRLPRDQGRILNHGAPHDLLSHRTRNAAQPSLKNIAFKIYPKEVVGPLVITREEDKS